MDYGVLISMALNDIPAPQNAQHDADYPLAQRTAALRKMNVEDRRPGKDCTI